MSTMGKVFSALLMVNGAVLLGTSIANCINSKANDDLKDFVLERKSQLETTIKANADVDTFDLKSVSVQTAEDGQNLLSFFGSFVKDSSAGNYSNMGNAVYTINNAMAIRILAKMGELNLEDDGTYPFDGKKTDFNKVGADKQKDKLSKLFDLLQDAMINSYQGLFDITGNNAHITNISLPSYDEASNTNYFTIDVLKQKNGSLMLSRVQATIAGERLEPEEVYAKFAKREDCTLTKLYEQQADYPVYEFACDLN